MQLLLLVFKDDMVSNTPHLFSGWRFRVLLISMILTVAVYLLFTLWAGWDEVSLAFDQLGIEGALVPISLSTVAYLLRFMRWTRFLNILGYHIPLKDSFRIYIGGFAFSVTPGKTGEALRSVFLKDFGVPYRQSFGAFLAERFSDVMAVGLLAAGGLMCCPTTRPIMYFVIVFVTLILLVIQKESFLKKIGSWLKWILPDLIGQHIDFILEIVLSFRKCFSLATLFFAISIGVIAWGLEGIGCYLLLYMLHVPISLYNVIFIYSFSLLVGALTFLPGGLGGAEISLIQLLTLYGVPQSIAVAVTIMIRLGTLWWSVFLGILFLPRKLLKTIQ